MRIVFVVAVLVAWGAGCGADEAAGTSILGSSFLTASSAGSVVDYAAVTRAQIAYVPQVGDLTVRRIPNTNSGRNAPVFAIHVTYERGCEDSDTRYGNEGFPDLDCVYRSNGTVACYPVGSGAPDPFFAPGSKVFFASGIKLWVELFRGLRVDVSVPVSKLAVDADYCDRFNDQTAVMDTITQNLLQRTYPNIAQYYTYDVVFAVNVEAFEYVGLPTVIAYFYLGDPTVSDAFETLNSTLLHTVSSGSTLLAAYNLTIKSLQLPEGQNVYWDVQIQQARFDEHNQIYEHRIYVDGLKVATYYPSNSNPNATLTCQTIMQYCVGSLVQFNSTQACLAFMGSIPLLKGTFAQSVGTNDVGCRQFHSSLLSAPAGIEGISGADIHCKHVGPYNAVLSQGSAGLLVTPCVDETGPPTPYPAATARRVIRDVGGSDQDQYYYYACDDPQVCKYKRVRRQPGNLLWQQVAMSEMHEKLIPAAGAILQACLDAGTC